MQMNFLSKSYSYRQGTLYCGQVALADIAESAGTPLYVYAASDIVDNFRAYDEVLA